MQKKSEHEQIVEVLRKCKQDFVYACPKLLKIRTKNGELIPFKPYEFQEKVINDKARKRAVLKGRQEGLSTAMLAEAFLDVLFNPQIYALVIAPDEDSAENLFRIINRFYDNLPPVVKREKKYSTKKLIEFKDHDSVIAVQTAGKKNLGRSYTWNRVHVTEVDYIEDFANIIIGLKDSVPASGKWIYETTANGINSVMHGIVKAQKRGDCEFSYHFIGWTELKEYRRGDDNTVLENGLTVAQQSWKDWKIKDYMNDGLKEKDAKNLFRQEYPQNDIECFIISGGSVFDKGRLEHDMAIAKPGKVGDVIAPKEDGPAPKPVFIQNQEGYLTIWKEPDLDTKHRYVAGIDVAEGLEVVKGTNDRDYSIIEIFDRMGEKGKLEQVAEWRGKVDAAFLAEIAHNLLRYYGDAFATVEANSDGVVVNRYLLDTYHYTRLYHREVKSGDYIKESQSVGFKTHRGTRPILVNGLLEMYNADNESDIIINSRTALEEMHTFIKDTKGTPRGAQGCHDDCVIAMCLAIEGLTQAPTPKTKEMQKARDQKLRRIKSQKGGDIYNSAFSYGLKKYI